MTKIHAPFLEEYVLDEPNFMTEFTEKMAVEWGKMLQELPPPPKDCKYSPKIEWTYKKSGDQWEVVIYPKIVPIRGTVLNPFPPSD